MVTLELSNSYSLVTFAMMLLVFLEDREFLPFLMYLKTLSDSTGKGQIMEVKSYVQYESSIWLEQEITAVFNIVNLLVRSKEQNIIAYWDQLAHSIFSIGITYITLQTHLEVKWKTIEICPYDRANVRLV